MNTETNKEEKYTLEDAGYYRAMQGLLDIAEGGRRIEEWNIVMSEADYILDNFISEQIKLAREEERELQTKLKEIAINTLITDINTARKEAREEAIDECIAGLPNEVHVQKFEKGTYYAQFINGLNDGFNKCKESLLNLKKK